MIIRKITPLKMKAVIATDSISLRSRKMLLTFECPQDILINRSRPVHEATGGHAVRGNYCIHHALGNFADNHTIFHANIDLKWRIYDFSNNFLSFMDIQPNIILEILAP